MSRTGRVKGRRYFDELRRSKIRSSRGPIRITFSRADVDRPCVCFSVGRRFGGAVARNRMRRRLRSVFSEVSNTDKPGVYLIGADRSAAEMSYEELSESVKKALESLTERAK